MPWSSSMDRRRKFMADVEEGIYSFAELCDRYGISRQNGYKWKRRYDELGEAGLVERSRAPHSCPHRVAKDVAERIVEVRKAHVGWGAATIVKWIRKNDPAFSHRMPAASTVHRILLEYDLVKRRRRKRGRPPTTPPITQAREPNDVWTIDFKGEFPMLDGVLCYPLTLADDFSRFLLACEALPSIKGEGVYPIIERIFREYGLPRAILSDNGPPFGTAALARLSRLAVWWIRLGIRIERIEPGKPQQNPRHERMHGTLARDTVFPLPEANMPAQQGRFDGFRHTYNFELPHSAHGDLIAPGDIYYASPRPYPNTLPEIEYPGYYHKRKVSTHGYIQWRGHLLFLSRTFRGEYIGLHEIETGIWAIDYGPVELARYDERDGRLHTGGAHGPRALRDCYDGGEKQADDDEPDL